MKKLLLILLFSILSTSLYSQEEYDPESNIFEEESYEKKDKDKDKDCKKCDEDDPDVPLDDSIVVLLIGGILIFIYHNYERKTNRTNKSVKS